MRELEPWATQHGTVVDLGSRDGHDARRIADIFKASRVITIEANPEQHKKIQAQYPEFENYNCAITDNTGSADFYAVRQEYPDDNIGQSSLLYRSIYDGMANKVTVPTFTMDDFVDQHNITSIDCLKIDVEGATYQVLTGFTKLRMTRVLHIESEHVQHWQGQRLYEDTERIMLAAGYQRVYFQPVWTDQSDTIWVRND